ncbi:MULTISPECIES: cytochrome b [Methylomonas]|uniref:Cytochrome b n=2 Tax=Methylomonas TaxID=416 RepID=A0A126T2I5_9GAMM|nr:MULTISPECIES: cytochrome bc complex cytochrome b subunit [Methylomonas]AMK76300.1 cytochrome B [Methylomonas denitrificans]OAI00739.1 cytochrome B [Methylomonas methanica]TCV88319.1 ubiquinol-cytochrome c reductase cytochrome b subunit [Methylomonas methanica]
MKQKMNKCSEWLLERFPLSDLWNEHMAHYYAPKNFNIWYFFGSLALFVLVNQFITGILLTMNYKPDAKLAFDSVEYIMRDVNWGWLVRYMHSTGASAFFIVVYLHMFRGLIYGSFKQPRELIWIFGMLIFVCLMAEAFMGYLLPWGQMSYWGAQVIISLFSAIPVIGDELSLWVRGDYVVSDATLNRFFAFHVIAVPLVLLILVFLHIVALHEVGSNNPDGVEIKQSKDPWGHPVDGIPFHPYYTVKDIVGVGVFMFFFATVIFYMPELGGYFLEHANFIPADPLKTPEHIAPVWYFTPFYAILRAVPDKFAGVIAMGGAIVVLFMLPWLDRSPVKSIRYRGGMFKKALALFVIAFVGLGYLGTQPATPGATTVARVLTAVYFGFFLLMPLYTRWEKTKPVPNRLTTQPSLEDRIPALLALVDEVVEVHQVPDNIGGTIAKKRPNWSGISAVLIRFAKNLKKSLD